MSCHDIGRGLNEVTKKVVELYEEGKISQETAKDIIKTCGDAVNWCDGNTGEAISFARYSRCAECFKIIPKGEPMYSLWHLNYQNGRYVNMQDKAGTAWDILCKECIHPVIKRTSSEYKTLEEMVNVALCKDTSPGEDPVDNNGYPWPKR